MPVDGDGTIDCQKTDEHSLEPEQTASPDSGPTMEKEHVLDDDGQLVRSKRTRKLPGHLRDFIIYRIQQVGLVIEARSSSTGDQTTTAPGQLLTPEQADRLLNPCEAHAVWFRDADQALHPTASFAFPAVNVRACAGMHEGAWGFQIRWRHRRSGWFSPIRYLPPPLDGPPVELTGLSEASSFSSSNQVQLTCSSDGALASSEDTRSIYAVSHCRYMAQRSQVFQRKRREKYSRPCSLCSFDG